MVRLYRSALAEQDLNALVEHTVNTWGVAQAEKYVDMVETALATITAHPDIGTPRFEVRPGVLAYHLSRDGGKASHFVYYRVTEAGDVQVIRILHDKMDPYRQL